MCLCLLPFLFPKLWDQYRLPNLMRYSDQLLSVDLNQEDHLSLLILVLLTVSAFIKAIIFY